MPAGGAWLVLLLAGLCEVGWAVGLKFTDGFSRLLPSAAPSVPWLRAPKDPHMLRNAAGECATARNMWGLAPKADWIGASNWRRSGVVAAGSIRDRRWGMVGSVGG